MEGKKWLQTFKKLK